MLLKRQKLRQTEFIDSKIEITQEENDDDEDESEDEDEECGENNLSENGVTTNYTA